MNWGGGITGTYEDESDALSTLASGTFSGVSSDDCRCGVLSLEYCKASVIANLGVLPLESSAGLNRSFIRTMCRVLQ